MEEIWKDLIESTDYQISNLGRVRSFKKYKKVNLRIITSVPDKDNYLVFTIHRGSKGRLRRLVHKEVLKSFVGPAPDGMWALHRDGNNQNNNLENLYWGTPTSNCNDRKKHGKQFYGSNTPNAVFSEQDIKNIMKLRREGQSIRSISKLYGRAYSILHRICTGQRYKKESGL